MPKDFTSNILTVLFATLVATSTLWSAPSKEHNLTDAQLNAFLGIITNFILSDEPTPKVLHFVSSSSVTVAENQSDALTVVATEAKGTVTYSLSGGDSTLFSINSSTGTIVFNTIPDFETRTTYSFTVTATDSSGQMVSQTVTVHISDRLEGQLKKTGQTKSYDVNGNEVTDNSLKDDGFYKKGRTPSYTRDDVTNIVIDHVTGLEWTDDANVSSSSMSKRWLTTTNYDICRGKNGQTKDVAKCTDTTGDTAATYCSTLTLGTHTDWRLPTIEELLNIADRSDGNTDIDTTVFQNVALGSYWTYSTVVDKERHAWVVYFNDGDDSWIDKSGDYYVRCVRDGQL